MNAHSHDEGHEPEEQGVRINDRRRIDPETFEVREQAAPAPDAVEVEADVIEVESKVAELTEDLQRLHAEYANYRKRVERDRGLIQETAVASMITELLPILDDLDRARQHGEFEGGFKTVGEALEGVLQRFGLQRFGEEGVEFDPVEHEAMTHETRSDVQGPTVVTVYQPGYRIGERLLRPARVAVADSE